MPLQRTPRIGADADCEKEESRSWQISGRIEAAAAAETPNGTKGTRDSLVVRLLSTGMRTDAVRGADSVARWIAGTWRVYRS